MGMIRTIVKYKLCNSSLSPWFNIFWVLFLWSTDLLSTLFSGTLSVFPSAWERQVIMDTEQKIKLQLDLCVCVCVCLCVHVVVILKFLQIS